LGPESFAPPPKVRSAVVRMRMGPRFAELGVDEEGFLRFLKTIFAQKRKTLSNNLKSTYDKEAAAAALAEAGIAPSARAESIPLEQMARLYRALEAAAAAPAEPMS
jgi:16S rRNA (adenine1518-N6/adenine1519-N6)-dimethyltransferase